jgi:hypothetical protein
MRRSAQRRRRLGSGAFACLLLASGGLVGGLFLAFFSFNSSEAMTRVGSIAPEVIYVRPDTVLRGQGGEAGAVAGESIFAGATLSLAIADPRGLDEEGAFAQAVRGLEFDSSRFAANMSTSTFVNSSQDGSGSWSTFSSAGAGETANVGGAAWDAVLLPQVPEPSTWALLVGGLGAVAAAARRRRN